MCSILDTKSAQLAQLKSALRISLYFPNMKEMNSRLPSLHAGPPKTGFSMKVANAGMNKTKCLAEINSPKSPLLNRRYRYL